jgi:acetyl-CoA carboxylase biotin carboxyl carrier protein
MNEFELAEIDLRQAEHRIRLRKGGEPLIVGPSLPAPPPTHAAAASASTGSAPSSPPPAAEAASGKYVTSPMVGTFYVSASPDAPPFVKVGDQIGPESVVCIIEAMKVFNEIPAECTGKVTAVLVDNGDAVEYGQKLFRVE